MAGRNAAKAALKGTNKSAKITIHLAGEGTLTTVKAILAYEAAMRGRTLGQVCSDLINEAVDTNTYPEEVKARLTQIAQDSERRAVEKSLKMSVPGGADED